MRGKRKISALQILKCLLLGQPAMYTKHMPAVPFSYFPLALYQSRKGTSKKRIRNMSIKVQTT